jgi:translation initiation factor IF-3
MIRVSPIFLIDGEGNKIGETATSEALEMAQNAGLDLVEIVPSAKPPVCKIIDWGKYQYQQSKKKQDSGKKKSKVVVKGVRLRPATGENDLDFKLKQVEKFLKKDARVKIEIILRGREKAFRDASKKKLQEFVDKIEIPVKIEQSIQKQFNGWNILVAPKK